MIQFNEQELGKIEDELYEALSHLEDAPEYEAEGSVNLLRVGQKMGQATQVIKRVNDIIGGKLRDAKLRSASKDSSTFQSQINDNIRQALDQHRKLFSQVRHPKQTPTNDYSSPWDDSEDENDRKEYGCYGSRD